MPLLTATSVTWCILIVCKVRLYVRSFTPIPARNTSIRLIPTAWYRLSSTVVLMCCSCRATVCMWTYNELYAAVGDFKRSMRYKSQLLACAVVDVKPADRINDSKKLLEQTKQLVAQSKGKVADEVVNYVSAESEGLAYTSFVEYPPMYEETRKMAIGEQGIGDYWNIMNGCKLRDDAASLSCPDYCSFLLLNMAYTKSKQAHEKGEKYQRPDKLEDMFAQLASFYDGARRDVVLYSVITNYIQGGKDIERVEPLIKQFKEKYCVDKRHAEIIDAIMQ